ncbi:MAG: CpcT/CpeT family chromophore lyase [Steroidobacteraceae bacterium]
MAVDARIKVLAALALLQVGCAPQPKRDEVMVNELVVTLAGSYDNIAQSRSSSEHPALRLMVAPVQAPAVGDHVFYVQEMAADDPRRVLTQRVYVLNGVPGREQAILTQLDLNEPLRWRDGHLHREVFRSLLTQDMRARPGCDLLWTRKPVDNPASKDKPAFAGFVATTGSTCRTAARSTGETMKVEQRMELNADGLAVFEQQRDAAGVLAYGDLTDPFFRYARRADAPW